jgi:Flp pilus assembly protein CpaB
MAAGGKKSNRIIIYIVLIVVAAFALIFILISRNKQANPTSTTEPTPIPISEMINIVITTQSISMGTSITQDVVTLIPYPRSELVEGTFFTDITEVVGKRARYNLDARVPLTQSMIVDVPSGSMYSFLIPAGMTAYSIPLNFENSVSFAPQVGDHVMIIGCFSLADFDQEFQSLLPNWTAVVTLPGPPPDGGPSTATIGIATTGDSSKEGRVAIDPNLNQAAYLVPSESQRPRVVCQTVIQDSAVLLLGQAPLEGTTLPVDEGTTTTTIEPNTSSNTYPDHVTLIVSPQDAVTLTYLQQMGISLTLALRSAGDLQTITTQSVTLQFVMDQKSIQLPAQLPYGIYPSSRDLYLESLAAR